MSTELMVLANLFKNVEYTRTVFPHLKRDYFSYSEDQVLFDVFSKFYTKYKKLPPKEAVNILVEKTAKSETEVEETVSRIEEVFEHETMENMNFLLDTTEQFCKDSALYNAIKSAVSIIDDSQGKNKKSVDSIPSILKEALGISFDNSIGMSYFDDAERRYEMYHNELDRLKFCLTWLNDITGNGLPKKSLLCILARPNAGKTTLMTNLAADYVRQGKTVLYISMEMGEDKISEKIDANLMNTTLSNVFAMDRVTYLKKIDFVRRKYAGNLIVKEYPTASAHTGHFEALLSELEMKQGFIPDVVFVDYLNICLSTRYSSGGNNSYTIVKGIAEELRGLASERNFLCVTATQTTRNGVNANDIGMEDVSESIGIAATVDVLIAAIRTEQLDQQGQILLKQVKNRFGDTSKNIRSLIGVDWSKMRMFDVDAQSGSLSEESVVDMNTESSKNLVTRFKSPTSKSGDKFGSIKI